MAGCCTPREVCTESVRTQHSWRRRIRDLTVEARIPRSMTASGERPYPAWLIGGSLPRRRWDDPEVISFLRRGLPLVLTGGCPLAANVVGKWCFEYMGEQFGSISDLSVHFAPRATSRFERFYGQGLGKGGGEAEFTCSFPLTVHAQPVRRFPLHERPVEIDIQSLDCARPMQ